MCERAVTDVKIQSEFKQEEVKSKLTQIDQTSTLLDNIVASSFAVSNSQMMNEIDEAKQILEKVKRECDISGLYSRCLKVSMPMSLITFKLDQTPKPFTPDAVLLQSKVLPLKTDKTNLEVEKAQTFGVS